MANPRKTRGEYRPIFEALFTGADYRALHKDAKLAFLTFKGLCGVMGIKVWPAIHASLAELTAMSEREAVKAVAELIAGNWIQYESGVVWVVRGLRFEPQMTPNNPDHRKRMRELASGLPTCPIVARFREEYADYFTEAAPAKEQKQQPTSATPSIPPSERGSDTPSPTPTSTPVPPLPHLLPVSTPVATSSPSDRPLAEDMRLLTMAANAGLDKRYPHRNPLVASSGHAHVCAASLREHGVDLEFAAAAIFAYASTMTKDDPPHSLKYFTKHVIERWLQDGARREAAEYRPGATANAEIDQMRTFAIRYAQEGNTDWQEYCDDRQYAWRDAA